MRLKIKYKSKKNKKQKQIPKYNNPYSDSKSNREDYSMITALYLISFIGFNSGLYNLVNGHQNGAGYLIGSSLLFGIGLGMHISKINKKH